MIAWYSINKNYLWDCFLKITFWLAKMIDANRRSKTFFPFFAYFVTPTKNRYSVSYLLLECLGRWDYWVPTRTSRSWPAHRAGAGSRQGDCWWFPWSYRCPPLQYWWRRAGLVAGFQSSWRSQDCPFSSNESTDQQ